MPILNEEKSQVVIRIVYDGLALSGKTTTLRMLANSLEQEFYTPEEMYGRTVFFDWVGYTGGLFEGYQIRCQIITVPGQAVWAVRRKHIIDSADAVVYVGDTTRDRFADSLNGLKSLHQQLQQLPEPPVGIIFQANKRDLVDTVPLDEIQRELGAAVKGIAVIESVASEGSGIRQAFVFGVRLCLDRVRELLRTNSLPVGAPAIDSGEDLLREIRTVEENIAIETQEQAVLSVAENDDQMHLQDPELKAALCEVFRSEDGGGSVDGKGYVTSHPDSSRQPMGLDSLDRDASPPLLPHWEVPSGMIWPPVGGRIILSEATSCLPQPFGVSNGDWTVTPVECWNFYSYKEDVFNDLSVARKALINWAQQHIALLPVLSPLRCLVLAETGHGTWRLWQIVRVEESLLSMSSEALEGSNFQQIASQQFKTLRYKLSCSLDNLSLMDDGSIRYNGLVPSSPLLRVNVEDDTDGVDIGALSESSYGR